MPKAAEVTVLSAKEEGLPEKEGEVTAISEAGPAKTGYIPTGGGEVGTCRPWQKIADSEDVKKRVEKPGCGHRNPKPGERVFIKWSCELEDGSIVEEKQDDPLELFLMQDDDERVVVGVHIALASMKLGEIARVKIAPAKAYGSKGKLPLIPADSTIIYVVELVNFHSVEDLSDDGGVIKTTIMAGKGYQYPNDLTTVRICFAVHLVKDGLVSESAVQLTGTDDNPAEFIIDEDQIKPRGFETAVRMMKKGERATVRLQPQYAYGSSGNTKMKIPANAELEIVVVMVGFDRQVEPWEVKGDNRFAVKLMECDKRKLNGNDHFKRGLALEKQNKSATEDKQSIRQQNVEFAKAAARYELALRFALHDRTMDIQTLQSAQQKRAAVHNNLSQVYLKLKKYDYAAKHASRALEIEPLNAKALFRHGCACNRTGEWAGAMQSLSAAQGLNPDDNLIAKELHRARRELKAQKLKEKALAKKMFGVNSAKTSPKSAVARNGTSAVSVAGKKQKRKQGSEKGWLTKTLEQNWVAVSAVTLAAIVGITWMAVGKGRRLARS